MLNVPHSPLRAPGNPGNMPGSRSPHPHPTAIPAQGTSTIVLWLMSVRRVKPTVDSRGVNELPANLPDKVVRYHVVLRDLLRMHGVMVDRGDSAKLDCRRGNVRKQVVHNGVALAPGVKVEPRAAQVLEDVAVETDIVGEPEPNVSGCAHDIRVVADDVGLVARADEVEPALVRDISVAAARAEPGGIGKGQTLASAGRGIIALR